jgi:hypothetical protein
MTRFHSAIDGASLEINSPGCSVEIIYCTTPSKCIRQGAERQIVDTYCNLQRPQISRDSFPQLHFRHFIRTRYAFPISRLGSTA